MTENANSENLDEQQENKERLEAIVQNKVVEKRSRIAVASLIFAILGLLSFLTFIHFFSCLHPIYRLFKLVSILGCTVSITLAITACAIIVLNKKLKGCWFAIAAVFILAFILILSSTLSVSMQRYRRLPIQSNLRELYQAIRKYCEDNGSYLPAADQWCDLLVEHNKTLSKDSFRYPSGKYGILLFVFNENLDGLRLDDIPNDVVLLFEADEILPLKIQEHGRWNLAGGVELLEMRYRQRKRFYVLLANGKVYSSNPSLRELFNEQLRWKP